MDNNQDTSLKDILDVLRKGFLLAMVVAVSAAVIVFLVSGTLTEVYKTEATLLIAQPEQGISGLDVSLVTAPSIDLAAYKEAAFSSPVLENARQILNDPNALDDVDIAVNITEMRISGIVNIVVEGRNKTQIVNVANALAQALVNWDERRASRNLTRAVTTLESQIEQLDGQIRALATVQDATSQDQYNALLNYRAQQLTDLNLIRTLSNSAVGAVDVLEPAELPEEPVAPNPLRNAIVAFALGIFISYALTLLRETLDTRLKTSDDLAKVSGLPIMAELPKRALRSPQVHQEAVSYLHTNLLFSSPNNPKVILVTSGKSPDEKSNIALGLAKSFARSEDGVLLVDADLREPAIAMKSNLNRASYPSLQNYLENPFEPLQPARVAIDKTHHLDIIPSFHAAPSPTELLRLGFRQSLEKWKDVYDVIIIDSAPLLAVADTLTIAPLCTDIVFTVDMQDTDRNEVRAAVDMLHRSAVRTVGLVATNVNEVEQGDSYGYGYGARKGSASVANLKSTRGAKNA